MTLAGEKQVYLASYLAPLAPFLAREDVTDIYVNGPRELWIETLSGGMERHYVPALDPTFLLRLSRQVAAVSNQGISREHPLLSATLPDGARIQIVAPPATRGHLALAIRKHLSMSLRLDDYAKAGAFANTATALNSSDLVLAELEGLQRQGRFAELLRAAVRSRLNIVIAGGTATGKTTFLNALIAEIPYAERLILIEDTPELDLQHPNAIGFIAVRSELGESLVSMENLLGASLRMRPDRIILGELRGPEAFTFLRAVNTGHPGSMTTVHADSPDRGVEQIALLVLQSGTRLSRDDVAHYVRSTTDVFVQLERLNGKRQISAVALRRPC